MREILPCG
ncbi:hypothetical protein YPPY91_4551, partial [Yersinia pestis PY-91]